MNNSTKVHNIIEIILYGTFWGFIETTLGGLLHFLHVPGVGSIMSAVGFGIMGCYFLTYNRSADVMFIGLISALIKCLDILIFPTSLVMDVLRPAMAIFLESLVLFAAIKAFNYLSLKGLPNLISSTIAGSFIWFYIYGLLGFFVFKKGIGVVRTLSELNTFVLSGALVSALYGTLIVALIGMAFNKIKSRILTFKTSNFIMYRAVFLSLSLFFLTATISLNCAMFQ